jgi:tetratricopeptide (TPR) repeat protein
MDPLDQGAVSVNEYGGFISGDFGNTFHLHSELTTGFLVKENLPAYPQGKNETNGAYETRNNLAGKYFLFGFALKYPIYLFGDRIIIAPKTTLEWQFPMDLLPRAGVEDGISNTFSQGAIDSLWFKFGGEIDFLLTKKFFLRTEALYTPQFGMYSDDHSGMTFNAGLGWRLRNDPIWELDGIRERQARDRRQKRINRYAKAASRAYEGGQYARAVSYYDRLLEIDPGRSSYYLGRSNNYTAMGDFEYALEDYESAVNCNTNMLNNTEDFEKWRTLVSNYEDAYYQKAPSVLNWPRLTQAQAAYNRRDYKEAVEQFTSLVNGDRNRYEYSRGRSYAYYALGDYAHALEDFNRSAASHPELRTSPNDYSLWKNLIINYEKNYKTAAPTGGRAVMNIKSGSNLVMLQPHSISAGSSVSVQAGNNRTFILNWRRGDWYVNAINRTRDIEAGHVYQLSSEETNDNKVRTILSDITNEEIPVTLEYNIPDIGQAIDENFFVCTDRNTRGNGVYTWLPKGFPESRNRVKLNCFFTSDAWDKVTVYANSAGVVTGRDTEYEYRLVKESENTFAESLNSWALVRTGNSITFYVMFRSDGRFKTSDGAIHKEGTYNGVKADMYISVGGKDSFIYIQDERSDVARFRVIQRTGIIPDFKEN